jgi:aminoglycoside phosphotransferase (APT) family kinase protein
MRVEAALVRSLLAEQHPDLAGLPLTAAAEHGWDNAVFRLGAELAVRLPRRPLAVPLLAHELRWLPVLAPRLPLPVPAVVRTGVPGSGYPWPWSVHRWIPGEPLGSGTAAVPGAGAALAEFLRALHTPAPADAPRNPYRGIPLAERLPRGAQDAAELVGRGLPAGPWLEVLRRAAAAPAFAGAPHWCHGDLHTANVLRQGSRIAGVIDFGDLGAGDPAVDLAIAWMLPPAQRPPLLAHARRLDAAGGAPAPDPGGSPSWQRGRGWATAMALAVLAHGAPEGLLARTARATLAAVTARPDGPG